MDLMFPYKSPTPMLKTLNNTFNSIINAGIPANLPFEKQKKFRVQNQILFISIFIPFIYIILFAVLGFKNLMLIELTISASSILAYKLNINFKQRLGRIILLYLIPLQLLVFPLFVGDIGVEYFCFIFLIIGFYITDKKIRLIILSVHITAMFLITKHLTFIVSYPEEYRILETLCYYPNMIISMFLIILSTAIFKYDSIRYQTKVETQAKELSTKLIELESKEKLSNHLLKELNHRVKNNLQMISGLLTMQVYKYKNKNTVTALNAAKHRIDTIAILHQHLYKYDHTLFPSLKTYIQELSQYILQVSGMSKKVDLRIYVDDLRLMIETTIHIGLIINELLTNAFKYGLRENSNTVVVRLNKTLNTVTIKVSDAGPGFNKEVSDNLETFGLRLVKAILKQYNGTVKMDNSNGASVIVALETV